MKQLLTWSLIARKVNILFLEKIIYRKLDISKMFEFIRKLTKIDFIDIICFTNKKGVNMSVDLIRQNTPVLQQAAEQFIRGDVAGGKFSFALVHHDVKEGVYYTMWERNGRPPIPKYGTNRFNDTNEISSTSIEKAQTIYQYFQSKGIPTNSNFFREQVNSSYVPITLPYVTRSRGYGGGTEIRYTPSFTFRLDSSFNTRDFEPNFEEAQELVLAARSNCTEEELDCCGKGLFAGIAGFIAIVQIVDLIRVFQAYRS